MKRAALLAFMLLVPATANAQVSVLGLEADQGAEKMAGWVTKAMRYWVRAKGMRLGPEKDAVEVKLVYGCARERPQCMVQIAKAMKVNRLVFGKVRRRGGNYVVVLKHLSLSKPKNLDTLTRRVSVSGATYGSVKAAAAGWLSKLVGTTVTGSLMISAKPTGALLVVDGKQVGLIPDSGRVKLDLPPGKHTVVIRKEGYRELTRTVQVKLGKTSRVEMTMEKVAGEPGVTPRPRPRVVTRPTPGPTVPPIGEKKEEEPTSPKVWWQVAFYSSAGIAASLLVASIFTGRKVSDLESQKTSHLKDYQATNPGSSDWVTSSDVCSQPDRDAKTRSICQDGKKYATMTNAFLITGGIFAAAAGVFSYFAFIKDYDEEEPTPEEDASTVTDPSTPVRVSVQPSIWGRGAGMNVRLSF